MTLKGLSPAAESVDVCEEVQYVCVQVPVLSREKSIADDAASWAKQLFAS